MTLNTVRYDEEVDALYIRVAEGVIDDTAEVEPGVMVDIDAEGNRRGIEVLNASGRFPVREWAAAIWYGGCNYRTPVYKDAFHGTPTTDTDAAAIPATAMVESILVWFTGPGAADLGRFT